MGPVDTDVVNFIFAAAQLDDTVGHAPGVGSQRNNVISLACGPLGFLVDKTQTALVGSAA
jgi:hypothetical protein